MSASRPSASASWSGPNPGPPGGRQLGHGERLRRQAGRLGRVQVRDHPVDRAEPERVGVRVDQEREPVVPRAVALTGGPHGRAELVVGGVPVVAVGDQRGPRGEVGGDGRLLGRVGQRPEPVGHAVVGDRARERRPLLGRQVHQPRRRAGGGAASAPATPRPGRRCPRARRRRPPRYRRAGSAQGCHAPPPSARDGRRPGPASRPHAGGSRSVPTRDQPDQAALDVPGPALLVDVQGGRAVRRQHALVQPVAQPRRRDLPGRPRVAGPAPGRSAGRCCTARPLASALACPGRSRRTVVM